MQERLARPTNWDEICDVTRTDDRVIASSYISTTGGWAAVQSITRGTAANPVSIAETSENLTISEGREVPIFLDWGDMYQSPWTKREEIAKRSAQRLNEFTETDVLDDHANWRNIGGTSASAEVPIGSVLPYAGTTPPAGWMMCAGDALSVVDSSSLFNVIGYTYGGGGDTFRIPDLRSRIPVGRDLMGGSASNRIDTGADNMGDTGGTDDYTLVSNEIPSHTHTTATDGSHSHSVNVDVIAADRAPPALAGDILSMRDGDGGAGSTPSNARSSAGSLITLWSGTITGDGTHDHTLSNTGGGSSHSVLQPFITLNYIIRYQ